MSNKIILFAVISLNVISIASAGPSQLRNLLLPKGKNNEANFTNMKISFKFIDFYLFISLSRGLDVF